MKDTSHPGKTQADYLKSKYKKCCFPGEICSASPIRAHSIQRKQTLDQISQNGHIIGITPKVSLSPNEIPLEFKKIGINKATTFLGLCSEHDQMVFRPIDTNIINLEDLEHLFLLAYRSVLHTAHAKNQEGYRSQIHYVSDEPTEKGLIACQYQLQAWHFYCWYKMFFDEIYLNRDFDKLTHTILKIGTTIPSIAVSSVLPLCEYPLEFERAKIAAFNVFPHENETYAVFSYFHADRALFLGKYGKLENESFKNKQSGISKLILEECENFALSPKYFHGLSREQKSEIMNYVFLSTIDIALGIQIPYPTQVPNLFYSRVHTP